MQLLLGAEAVGLGAVDEGIKAAFSYPGTPATEIFEFVERHPSARTPGGIVARWSPNEKVAYEEALGMSFIGRRSLVSMKHVGLNVAADPFMSSALTGVVGGLVVAVADDPGMHSSQNEQDTRFYGDFAHIPVLEPSNQQEAYDMTREAFDLSERFGLPCIIRLVTRLSHSRSVVHSRPATQPEATPTRGNPNHWILLPVNARRRFRRLLELQPELVAFAESSPFNRLDLRGPRGVLASGIANNYFAEAAGGKSDLSSLKINTYPPPVGLIRRLVDHCDDLLVVEEGYPLLESRLTGLLGIPGKRIRGKGTGDLPPDGELTTEIVRTVLGIPVTPEVAPSPNLPPRPPALCQGCPHCDSFRIINDAVAGLGQPYLFSDIGCYTLGALPPYNAVHACVDMGASIGMAHGAAKGGAHPVICTIGDSTFTHSGMQPLLGAARDDANMTVVILDNAAVAMTGGQEGLMAGEDFLRLLRGLGVDAHHLVHFEPTPQQHDQHVALMRREIEHRGLSVLVASRACIHLKRRTAAKAAELAVVSP